MKLTKTDVGYGMLLIPTAVASVAIFLWGFVALSLMGKLITSFVVAWMVLAGWLIHSGERE